MLLTYYSFKQENNPTYSNEIQILPPSCTFICYFLNVSTALTVLHMCAKTNTKLFEKCQLFVKKKSKQDLVSAGRDCTIGKSEALNDLTCIYA